MSSNKTKKLIHWGWVTGEKRILRELEEQAKEGWLLQRCTRYRLILAKDIPRDIRYAVDLPLIARADEGEYLKYFEEAGWTLACRNYGFYIFYADKSAAPIHTDRALLGTLRKQRLKRMIPYTAVCFLLAFVFLMLELKVSMPFPLGILCILIALASAYLFGIFATTVVGLLRIHNNF